MAFLTNTFAYGAQMDVNGRSGDMVVFATVAEEGSLSAAARSHWG